MKSETNLKEVQIPKVIKCKALTTEQRLERLERLTVRLLLAMPLDSTKSRLINTDSMSPATRNALRKRYDQFKAFAGYDADYAKDCLLAICADDIAAEQATLDKAQAKADAEQQKGWRAQWEAEKAAAKKVLADVQAKLTGGRVDRPA